MKPRELRSKSVGTKVTEAELRVLESRAERAGLTLSEWVRDVLLGSSVEMGTLSAERAILAEVLAMRTILLNFMLKLGEGVTIPEATSKKLIEPRRPYISKRRGAKTGVGSEMSIPASVDFVLTLSSHSQYLSRQIGRVLPPKSAQ